jgi:CPA1 family monovalent cation:H+ antiporter
VVQGLTLPPLIRRLKVAADWGIHEEEHRAKVAMTHAAMEAIDAEARRGAIAGDIAERIRAEFAEKVTLDVPGREVARAAVDPAKQLRRVAIEAERRELIRVWRENQISDEVLHALEEDLDYQESRL